MLRVMARRTVGAAVTGVGRRLRRTPILPVWLAVIALLCQSVPPYVALAAAASSGGPGIVVCTTDGIRIVKPVAPGHPEPDRPDPASASQGGDCPFCLVRSLAVLPPPLAVAAVSPPLAMGTVAPGVRVEAARWRHDFLVGRPSRAPPSNA